MFFAGRIETNKGVYDLLQIALRLEADRKGAFHFDICGDGGQLVALRKRISELKLEKVVSSHGYCRPDKLARVLGGSHAWIVPTRSECEAGYEMVCAEAILANRPLITSAVCPALEDMRDATVEVQPHNIDQYCQAIFKLCDDPRYYSYKQGACAALQEPFYNLEKSWASKMKEVLAYHILYPRLVRSHYRPQQDQFIERQIGDCLARSAILNLKILQPLHLLDLQPPNACRHR